MPQTVTLFYKLHALQQNLLFTFKIQQMKETCYDVDKCIIVSPPPFSLALVDVLFSFCSLVERCKLLVPEQQINNRSAELF